MWPSIRRRIDPVSTSATVHGDRDGLYRPVSGSAFHLGGERVAICSEELPGVTEIDAATALILARCDGARTLEDHLRLLSEADSAARAGAIRDSLHQLVSRRLLIDDVSALISECRRGTPPPTCIPITTIGIVTADRPQCLRNSLASVISHLTLYGNTPRVVVLDGSRIAGFRSHNRELVRASASSHNIPLLYIGPAEASRMRSKLGLSESEWRGLGSELTPGAVGAERNLLLLLTAGEHAMMVDDDIILSPWEHHDRREGVSISGHIDPSDTQYFSSRADAFEAATPSHTDVVSAHMRLLGKSLRSVVGSTIHSDVGDACRHVLTAFVRREEQVVRVTFAGLAGDSAAYCPHRALFMRGLARERIRASAATFTTATRSREVLRVVRQDVVTHHPLLKPGCMAISNLTLLPPFISAGRNEGGVFAATLALCDPSALFGQISHGVIHDSPCTSPYPTEMISACQTRLADFLLVTLRLPQLRGLDSVHRIQALGGCLTGLSEMELSDFRAFVAEVMLEHRAGELTMAEAMINDRSCPPHFRDALRRYRATVLARITHPHFYLPIEFHRESSLEDGFRALQAWLRTFGRLLTTWPSLWQRAGAVLKDEL